MVPQELRIGNYYLYKGKEIKFDVSDFNEVNHNLIGLLEPIPLNEEWLLKFGFNAMLNQFKKKGNSIFIILKLENHFRYDDLRFRTHLKSVHQLQNLYFALTGKELTLI